MPADINQRREDFVSADMSRPLPFETGEFDVVVCLEGIEHLIDPVVLVSELIRVVRPGGRIYLSTPNIMNYDSRLQFLFTGTFYQFNPANVCNPEEACAEDRGHISPISFCQLHYLAGSLGAEVVEVFGDRFKRKVLLPVYGLLYLLGRPWTRMLFKSRRAKQWGDRNSVLHRQLNSPALLLSRTMILVLRKRDPSCASRS